MSTRQVRSGAVLGAVAVVAALTACSGGSPGAAAVADGRTIPVSDVDQAMSELGGYLQGATPAAIVGVLVQQPVVSRIAAEEDVAVSDQQAREQLDALAQQSGDDDPADFGPASLDVMRYVLELNALQQLPDAADLEPRLMDDLQAVDVTVNPRFGQLQKNGTIGATVYPWLVPSGDDPAAATP